MTPSEPVGGGTKSGCVRMAGVETQRLAGGVDGVSGVSVTSHVGEGSRSGRGHVTQAPAAVWLHLRGHATRSRVWVSQHQKP